MSVNPERLTLRNRIAEMFRAGQNVAQIAEALKLPTRTVEGHLRAAGVLQEVVQVAMNQQEEATITHPGDEVMRDSHSNDTPEELVESEGRVHRAPIPKGLSAEEIAEAIRRGESHRQIAARLGVAPQTINYHVAKARRLGLLEPRSTEAGRKSDKPAPSTERSSFEPGTLAVTIHLPMPISELAALMQAVEQALPQRAWSVEGAGQEMRLIGRRQAEEAKAA